MRTGRCRVVLLASSPAHLWPKSKNSRACASFFLLASLLINPRSRYVIMHSQPNTHTICPVPIMMLNRWHKLASAQPLMIRAVPPASIWAMPCMDHVLGTVGHANRNYILVLVSVQIKRLSRSHNHARTICIYHSSRHIPFLVRGKYICALISKSKSIYLI
jgi:hypothetical protein